jgi:hypothetical protein
MIDLIDWLDIFRGVMVLTQLSTILGNILHISKRKTDLII